MLVVSLSLTFVSNSSFTYFLGFYVQMCGISNEEALHLHCFI